jgi:hypothetical protein
MHHSTQNQNVNLLQWNLGCVEFIHCSDRAEVLDTSS